MSEILKVFGSGSWHDSVEILGDRQALKNLRDSIDEALETGGAFMNAYEVDGEGYPVFVVCTDDWEGLPLHYIEDNDLFTRTSQEMRALKERVDEVAGKKYESFILNRS